MATTHPQNKETHPKSDQCLKGINWGQYNLEENRLSLKHNSQTLLSLPLGKIVNTSVLSKNEVVIELPFDEFKDELFFFPLKQTKILQKGGSIM